MLTASMRPVRAVSFWDEAAAVRMMAKIMMPNWSSTILTMEYEFFFRKFIGSLDSGSRIV